MRYLFGFLCVCALGMVPLVGCTEGGGVPCEDDVDCPDDNNACTGGHCDEGFCVYPPVECAADFNDCTAEICDPTVGCEQSLVADGTQCAGGTCQAGVCELAGSVLPCSEQGIRNAIAAGGEAPYTFSCEGPSEVVTKAEIVIDNNVILDGQGNLTVDGNDDHRVFRVDGDTTAELRGFVVTRGAAMAFGEGAFGGGILNEATLTLTNSTVSGNNAALAGGGVCNWEGGEFEMTNSTVSGNGSSILRTPALGGGVYNEATMTMTNSTVSGNQALHGAGINNNTGTLTMTNSTLSGNIGHDPEDSTSIVTGGPMTVTNSLIDGDCSIDGVVTSNGYNIESPGNTCGFDQDSDKAGVTPEELNLGPLQNNGGPTMTHALGADSDAINRIPAVDCGVTTDQRGAPRPEMGGIMCDVGAFEFSTCGIGEPDPWQPGDERLSVGMFYECGRSETIFINDVTTHYFIFVTDQNNPSETLTYRQGTSGDRLEGRLSTEITLNGTPWWGGGIIWDVPFDLSEWTTMFVGFKSSDPSFANFDLTVKSGEGEEPAGVALDPTAYGYTNDGEWHFLQIPLQDAIDLGWDPSTARSPFIFGAVGGDARDVLLIDNLYFTKD